MTPEQRAEGREATAEEVKAVARAIARSQYILALKMSKNPVCRAAADKLSARTFESAWSEDTGSVRTMGMFAAVSTIAAYERVRK